MRTHIAPLQPVASLLAVLVTLTGCAYGEMTQVLRTQVASETNCAETKVSKRYIYDGADDNEYQVTGCGQTRRYVCPADEGLYSYDEPVCTESKNASDKPKLAKVGEDELLEGSPEVDTAAPAEEPEAEEPEPAEEPEAEPEAEEAEAEEPEAEEAEDEASE